MFKIFPLNPPFSLGGNPIPFKGRRCSQIYPLKAISGPGFANKSRVAYSLQTLDGIFPNKRNKFFFGILMYSLSFLILYLSTLPRPISCKAKLDSKLSGYVVVINCINLY